MNKLHLRLIDAKKYNPRHGWDFVDHNKREYRKNGFVSWDYDIVTGKIQPSKYSVFYRNGKIITGWV